MNQNSSLLLVPATSFDTNLPFPLNFLNIAVVPFFRLGRPGARGAIIRLLRFGGVDGGFRPGHMRVCALT